MQTGVDRAHRLPGHGGQPAAAAAAARFPAAASGMHIDVDVESDARGRGRRRMPNGWLGPCEEASSSWRTLAAAPAASPGRRRRAQRWWCFRPQEARFRAAGGNLGTRLPRTANPSAPLPACPIGQPGLVITGLRSVDNGGECVHPCAPQRTQISGVARERDEWGRGTGRASSEIGSLWREAAV